MEKSSINKKIIQNIYNEYLLNGYVKEERITDALIEYQLPFDEIDQICDQLVSLGVIIQDNDLLAFDKQEGNDRSQIDYEDVFCKVIEIDPSLATFIDEVREIRPPGNREAQNLIGQASSGNLYAKERIVSMYLKTVVRIALWYHNKFGIPLADAIQDGAIGLIKAIEKFDIGKQDKFSTYSPWWIRQMINREAPAVNATVYFPVHVKDRVFSIYDLVSEHECEFCGDKNPCENLIGMIVERLSCSESQALDLTKFIEPFGSVEELVEMQHDSLLADDGLFMDELITLLYVQETGVFLSKLFENLPDRESNIVRMRFGFGDDREKTLDEIGKKYRLTRERIRQIETKALKRLKKQLHCWRC